MLVRVMSCPILDGMVPAILNLFKSSEMTVLPLQSTPGQVVLRPSLLQGFVAGLLARVQFQPFLVISNGQADARSHKTSNNS
jgi:hypothetical protein